MAEVAPAAAGAAAEVMAELAPDQAGEVAMVAMLHQKLPLQLLAVSHKVILKLLQK